MAPKRRTARIYGVAASRKRGMWMGGYVPLGYDVRDRKL